MAKKQHQQTNPVTSREPEKALAAAKKLREEEEEVEVDAAPEVATKEASHFEEDDYLAEEESESFNSFKHANLIRKGDLVMLRGQPCKVSEYSRSKPGKHGHAKITLKGFNLFTGKKVEAATQSSSKIEVPQTERTDYSVNYIDKDGFAELMHVDTNETSSFQFRLDEEEDADGLYALDRMLMKKYEQSLKSTDDDKRLIATILRYQKLEMLVQIKEQK